MRTLLITHFRSDNSPTPRSRLLGGRRLWTGAVAVFVLMCFLGPVASQAWAGAKDDYANARQGMVETIAALAVLTEREVGRRALDTAVMDVMAKVPRHEFVPEILRGLAYLNRPLPIGHGQTISQPYIVALMTDLLRLTPGAKVLEIGTGSGYQATVLGELAAKAFTIEIIEPLGRLARKRLARLGYGNVEVRIGDGYYGWKEHAPFDAIIITAAASHVPPPLVRQLKPGGRMVIPVGQHFLVQFLTVVEKHPDGSVTMRQILPVRFVPLTGDH